MAVDPGQVDPGYQSPQIATPQLLATQAAGQLAQNLNQSYSVPAASTPVAQPPKYTPEILDSIKKMIDGLAGNHPAFQDGGANLNSYVLNAENDGKPKQLLAANQSGDLGSIAGTVIGNIFQQTIGNLVHTIQTDPLEGLKELGIGAAIIGGVAVANMIPGVGEAVDVGLLAWGATQTVPQLLGSLATEINDPTDANLTQALTNAGMTILTVGSPLKALRGIKSARLIASGQIFKIGQASKDFDIVDNIITGTASQKDLEPLLVSGRTARARQLNPNLPEFIQKEVRPEGQGLVDWLDNSGFRTKGGVSDEDIKVAEQYAELDGWKEKLLANVQKLKSKGEKQDLTETEQKMLEKQEASLHEFTQKGGEWQTSAQRFAHRFQFLATPHKNAFAHEMSAEESKLYGGGLGSVKRQSQQLIGRVAAASNSLHTMMDAPVEALSEVKARVASTAPAVANEIESHVMDIAGKLKVDRKGMERVQDALADPEMLIDETRPELGTLAESLSSGEKVMARVLQPVIGMMTGARVERGTIPLSDPNWVGMHVIYSNAADVRGNPIAQHMRSMLGDNWINHANWEVNLDHDTGLLDIRRMQTPASFTKAQGERVKHYEERVKMTPEQIQQVVDLRKQHGILKASHSKVSKSFNEAQAGLWKFQHEVIPDLEYQINQLHMQLQPLKKNRRSMGLKKQLLEEQAALEQKLKISTRDARRLDTKINGTVENPQRGLRPRALALEKSKHDFVDELPDDLAHHVAAKNWSANAVPEPPGLQEVLRGQDWIRLMSRQYIMDMVKTGHYDSLLARATTAAEGVAHTAEADVKSVGNVLAKEADWNKRPDILPESAFTDAKQAAEIGYRQIMGQMGTAKELNYRPALWAKPSIADPYLKAMNAATSFEELDGALGAVKKVAVDYPKRFIFLSPAIHFLNVAGRNLAQMMSDPQGYGKSLGLLVGKYFNDPASYAYLQSRYHMAGGMPAYRFQVTHHINELWSEEHGQHSWPGVIRTPTGVIRNGYNDIVEKGFWKSVDDVGLIGFLSEHAKLIQKGVHPDIAAMAAAEFGNNLSGTVNPLYMNKVWRHMRQLMSFAPSYWGTFMRSAESALMRDVPGFTRLGYHVGKQLPGLSPVRLRNLDYKTYREIVRAQSSWFHTYMAQMMVFADSMNQIGSGHHIWENDPGRTFDIDVSNFVEPGITPTGEEKRAYISSVPMFKQAVDVGNAFGIGHEWGLGHLMNDKNFQEQNAQQKGLSALQAMWDGVRRVGSGKISTAAQAGVIATMGLDPQQLLGTGRKIDVPNWEAFTALLPTGYTARRIINDWQKSQQNPDDPQQAFDIQQEMKAESASVMTQLSGMPSIYMMGAEKPHGLDDHQIKTYIDHRDAIHKEALQNSANAEDGVNGYTLYKWLQDRNKLIARTLELDTVTFGDNAPAGALSRTRLEIEKKYGLDKAVGMKPDDYYNKLDMFENEWDTVLQSAAPEARAVWWDHERKQWTNMDYLYWYTRQLKQRFMGMVDGQGGALIKQQQRDMYQKYGDILDVADPKTIADIESLYPAYYAYRQLLKGVGKASPLGAMIAGFTSPYAHLKIIPKGMTQSQAELLAEFAGGGQTFVSQPRLQQVEQGVMGEAGSLPVEEAGGAIQQTPGFQQGAQQLGQAGVAALEASQQ